MAFTDFDEMAGSPVLTVMPNNKRATRTGRITWSNTQNLIDELFPVGGLTTPDEFPGRSDLIASSVRFEPSIGEDAVATAPVLSDLDLESLNEYGNAKVTIEYETPQYDVNQGNDPVLLLTHRWSIGGEFITVESHGLQWRGSDEVSRDVTAGILIPTIEHQITWPRVANPPFNTIRQRLAHVNHADMTFNTGTIKPETLLFLGAELQRDILSDGALAWRVTYRFSERRVPLAPETVAYCTFSERIRTEDSGGNAYTSATCTADGGTFTSAVDADTIGGAAGADELTVGGWNHFYRSEDELKTFEGDLVNKRGFFRLTLKGETPPEDAIYRLGNFDDLFVEES
jgi:hypothetical protein